MLLGWRWSLAAALLLCAYLYRRKAFARDRMALLLGVWTILATLQCTLRAVKDSSLDERQFVPVVVLAGAWVFWRARRKPGTAVAVLAGVPAGAGCLCADPALHGAGVVRHLYVSDLARLLRFAGDAEPCWDTMATLRRG